MWSAIMTDRPLFTSRSGARLTWRPDAAGGGAVISTADVTPVIEHNKALANHNDGWAPSRELRRVASIPFALVHKWLVEEGWNALDPACAERLRAKLNDPDWRHLRTAPGRV
jgi:hypothetical protein